MRGQADLPSFVIVVIIVLIVASGMIYVNTLNENIVLETNEFEEKLTNAILNSQFRCENKLFDMSQHLTCNGDICLCRDDYLLKHLDLASQINNKDYQISILEPTFDETIIFTNYCDKEPDYITEKNGYVIGLYSC